MKKTIEKSGWNYRVVRVADQKLAGMAQTYSYGVYEVYYKDGVATNRLENPSPIIGENVVDIYEGYKLMKQAFYLKMMEEIDGKLIETRRVSPMLVD